MIQASFPLPDCATFESADPTEAQTAQRTTPGPSAGGGVAGEPFTYGDSLSLDALWDSCAGGDMAACDDLYMHSPFDSDYERFGDTCGETTEGRAYCDS